MPVNKLGIKNYTETELRKARKMGLRRARPKKPAKSATVTQMENFITRYNEYVNDVKDKAALYDRRARLQGVIEGIGKPIYKAPVRRTKKRTTKKRVTKRKRK